MLSPPTSRHAFFYAMLMPLGGLGMLIAGSRSSKKKLLASIALFCMLAMLMVLPACGGSSSKGGGGGGGGTNTPTGTYSLTVSGASGSVTHTVPLSLTVQ
jgi:ABC-type Co2+ transport system permease subunit